jgi:hypothetical protein
VALGGSPAEFWRQTPSSYVTVMEGMARAATRQVDLCVVTAWHTATFTLGMYAGSPQLKGKTLSDFLSSKHEPRATDHREMNARAIHFFNSLKARGVPVDITRTVH